MHKLKRLWQVLCLPKVSSVVVQLKSSEISKGMSVCFLVIGNNLSLVFVLCLTQLKDLGLLPFTVAS